MRIQTTGLVYLYLALFYSTAFVVRYSLAFVVLCTNANINTKNKAFFFRTYVKNGKLTTFTTEKIDARQTK